MLKFIIYPFDLLTSGYFYANIMFALRECKEIEKRMDIIPETAQSQYPVC